MPTGRSDLPWSPTYVKEDDRACERAVAQLLRGRGWLVQQAEDVLSRWDLRALNTFYQPSSKQRPWIYIEVRHRPKMDWEGRFMVGDRVPVIPIPGPLIDVVKADALIRISGGQKAVVSNGNTHGPVWFVVVPNDLTARVAWLSAERLSKCAIDTKDVNVIKSRNDLKDLGIAKYVIPWEHFHVLGKIDLPER